MNRLATARYGGMLALAAVVAVLPLILPNSFYYDMAILVGLNAIVCIGLNLLIGYAGQISLGHAGFFALGAYASAILTGAYGWPPAGALLAGAAGTGLLAFAVARPIMKLSGHYLAMGTLGLGIIISIVLTQEVELTGGPDGMPVYGFSIFGLEPSSVLAWYWIVGGLLLLTVWLAMNIVESPVGRALRAVHGSEAAARTAGIDVAHYKALIFVVSAAAWAASASASAICWRARSAAALALASIAALRRLATAASSRARSASARALAARARAPSLASAGLASRGVTVTRTSLPTARTL